MSKRRVAAALSRLLHHRRVGVFWLLISATLWGLAFVPQRITTEAMEPLFAIVVRFAIASPLALLIARRHVWPILREQPLAIALLGTVMAASFALQTWALTVTDVSRVALITGLYAAFVPLFAPLFGLRGPTRFAWVGLGVCLVGMALLVGVGDSLAKTPLNGGDLATLGCAALGGLQINLLGRLAPHVNPWGLNALQLAAVPLLIAPFAFVFEPLPLLDTVNAIQWVSFGYLAVFSSVVSFALQILGQRTTPPTTSGLIMLLEAPMGAGFGLIMFSEPMSGGQAFGSVLLVIGVALAILGDRSGESAGAAPIAD